MRYSPERITHVQVADDFPLLHVAVVVDAGAAEEAEEVEAEEAEENLGAAVGAAVEVVAQVAEEVCTLLRLLLSK